MRLPSLFRRSRSCRPELVWRINRQKALLSAVYESRVATREDVDRVENALDAVEIAEIAARLGKRQMAEKWLRYSKE